MYVVYLKVYIYIIIYTHAHMLGGFTPSRETMNSPLRSVWNPSSWIVIIANI